MRRETAALQAGSVGRLGPGLLGDLAGFDEKYVRIWREIEKSELLNTKTLFFNFAKVARCFEAIDH